MSLIEHFKKRGLKDVFSKRIFGYLQSQWQKVFGIRVSSKKDAIAYAEQVLFRGFMCESCKENGVCGHCGCSWEELATSQRSTCSQKKWGVIQDANSWAEYKAKYLHNVEFGLVKKKIKE